MTFRQHAKVLRFEVSVGAEDADRTLEQFEQAIKLALRGQAHNVTLQGGYYLIDGTVCLAADYDEKTKNRKPGTHPPAWAGGPATTKVVEPEVDDDSPREFVRVKPVLHPERHADGRRVRKDKGVKRGPRKDTGLAQSA